MDLKVVIFDIGVIDGQQVLAINRTITLRNVKQGVNVHDVEAAVRQILSKMGDLE